MVRLQLERLTDPLEALRVREAPES